MFTNAIVKKPCKALIHGITTANLGVPDFEKALRQHASYVKALEQCGVKVKVLEADENFPDSTFVEDTAVLTSRMAILTRPGADSRRKEIVAMKEALGPYFDLIETIKSPGTLDGGDVMMVGTHFHIGLSERTNEHGANQFIEILNRYGYSGSCIPLKTMLHLKTGLAYLENNNLLISGEFLNSDELKNYNWTEVKSDEAYAANSIWVNGNVLVPMGFPETSKKVSKLGYSVVEVDVSEFQKLDGGLSCLSLRF